MRFDASAVGALEATNATKVALEVYWTPSGRRITNAPSSASRIGVINDLTIQSFAIAKALDLLGEDAWSYGYKSGRRCNQMKSILGEVQDACQYKVKYKTFLNWFQHFLKFGETPAASRRRRKLRPSGTRATSFSQEDNTKLKRIIRDKPYLYLDEIQKEMKECCGGKVWHTSTLWRQMRRLGYSLQKAVFRARLQCRKEQERFMLRLEENTAHPRQYLVIDEVHKSANEARRERAWGIRGVTPVLDGTFDRGFLKRYTMIAAANINGFVESACHLVERDDNDADRGTVDMAKFEEYVEQYIVPVLGTYELDEENSIVIMDNATIHISQRVKDLIEEAGALLINTAPYSPGMNPIEYMFSVYKAALKRHRYAGIDWYDSHLFSLYSVTKEIARNLFRHCHWPGCENFGSEEEDGELDMALIAILLANSHNNI